LESNKTKILENYFGLPSSLIILFPYLVNLFLNSNLQYKFVIVPLVCIGLDLIFIKLKHIYIWKVLYISFLVIFFYCKILFNDTEIILHELRFREFFIIFSAFVFLIMSIILRLNKGLEFINIFFFLFGCTFFFDTESNKFYNKDYLLIQNNFNYEKKLVNKNASSSPVIFLLFDELSSSKEIYNHTQDSTDLAFDISLEKEGFKVISDFYSNSTHTKFSMPSIFNFNLHSNSSLLDSLEKIQNNVTIQKSFYWLASNNLLVDSLNKKSIKAYSYGLFPFNSGIIDNDFIYWWPSFLDPLRLFKNNSFLKEFFQDSLLKAIESVFVDTTSVEEFKVSVFEKFKSLNPKENSFYYFHFFAPHEPYNWKNEYVGKASGGLTPDEELDEHIKFRRFILSKTLPLIKSKKFKKCRIVISGDHGFRFNKKNINPNLTNLYLYNYPEDVLKNINSVQDIGYLIQNSFK
jgi:hypothetical protein